MVAKITIGSNLYGALSYNQEKVDRGLGKVLAANIVREPEDGLFHAAACMEDFERWMPSQYRTEKPIIHISLNPHPDDRLSDEQLSDMGREYMERLGYGGQPYLIFKHEDIDREHIHMVSLRVDSEGRLIKDAFEHKRSKEITQLLEQKYGLHPAQGEKQGEAWNLSPIDPARGNLKRQIASVIKPLVSMYHFQSMGEYKALLALYNTGMEEVKGELRGKPYRGLIYSAIDGEGNKVGTPLKSSLLGKTVGYDALEKRMEQSADKIKQQGFKERTRSVVADVMNESPTGSELRAKLREKGIDLYMRRNEEGRIYGVTFIDHNNRCVFNGSRLGKEFSANVFNERFGGQQTTGADLHGNRKDTQAVQAGDSYQFQTTTHGTGEAAGSLLSVLSPESPVNPDDYRQEQRKRKKKKRRYGRQM
jgi:hypothetical protein